MFYKNMRLKNEQNLSTFHEHTEVEERRRTYFGYCTKSWKYFVSRLMFVSATSPIEYRVVHVQLCRDHFCLL